MMTKSVYQVGNMDCANCAQELEAGVAKLNGVNAVRVDFVSGKMYLEGEVPFVLLQKRVEALGKTIGNPATEAIKETGQTQRGGVLGFWDYLVARHETQLALGGGALVLFTLIVALLGLPEDFQNALFVLGMSVSAYPIAKSGINGLRINHQFNINMLMTIAAVGAIIIGEYLESAVVIFLFAIGEALEGYTADRARQSITSLMRLKPATATVLSDEREYTVPVEELKIADVILVKAGENIPMDGRIQSGSSGVNQAPITGESVPVPKREGDEVFAGTINGEGTLRIAVTRLAEDNTLNRIITMVQEAQSERAPSQRIIDRFASWYTPSVVLMALLVASVPPLVFGAPFLDTGAGHGWLYRSLAMLVIACPCALVISTPVTIISAITAAARRGVLVKGGAHLEALGQIKAFAFDKTGTLTTGQPQVTSYRDLQCQIKSDGQCEACNDVLALASAVERRTAHPLAEAVVRAATEHHVANAYAPAEGVELLAGRGVRGTVGGHTVTIGSHALFDEQFPHQAELCQAVQALEDQGQTTMLLADENEVRGYIGLADQARESSKAVVQRLNEMGMATIMLTGDNQGVADAIGHAIGLSDVRAALLPDQKVEAIKALRQQYDGVAMVGDGVNDTPAMAVASVGIAMGGAGSPQALETADIALMADDLSQLPFAVGLAQKARHLIRENVGLSFGVKLVFLILAFFGLTSLWLAILADTGMALLVTLNGMRPLRFS